MNNPPLRKGSTGDGVVELQKALIHFGYDMPISTHNDTIIPDGIYGSETEATVRKFQTDQMLSADGVAGRDTLGRLDQMLLAEQATAFDRTFLESRSCFGTSGQKG